MIIKCLRKQVFLLHWNQFQNNQFWNSAWEDAKENDAIIFSFRRS